MVETLRYPNPPGDHGMTAWERLSKYGAIKGFRRKDDPQVYNAYLVGGMVKIVRATRCEPIVKIYPKEYTVTIDEFLWLFLRNLPCDYPQYVKA